MGEQPLHTCKAQVFTIDPKTMSSWCPSSTQSVDVSFFYDPNKACYRVVSIEENPYGKKVVIHCTVTEKMVFKKTSQKFGQWADSKAAVVYGLGFHNEEDLDRFVDQFTHAVEATKANKKDRECGNLPSNHTSPNGTATPSVGLNDLEKENVKLRQKIVQLERELKQCQAEKSAFQNLYEKMSDQIRLLSDLHVQLGQSLHIKGPELLKSNR